MSSWLQRQASSHAVQLAAAAALSGAVVAGTIFGVQHVQRKHAVQDLKASIPAADEEHDVQDLTEFGIASQPTITSKEDERSAALARRARMGDYDDELILEQLARNRVFLTDEGLSKFRDAFIIVVGLGGVGSHAVSALARSGATRIRLIDFDQVTLSSLNRHAVATLADVGTPKVHCLRRRLEQIVPWVKFDCRNELFNESVAERQLGHWDFDGDDDKRKPDFVLDCIDNIGSKVALLKYCYDHNIPVISSMGAGCKSDPTRVAIADISISNEDPLSRSTRRRLKLLGIGSGIPVVFSTEKPGPGKAQLLPLSEEEFAKGQVGDLGVLPDFRVRILPVLGTMPAVFGYTIANHVICTISGYPNEYNPGAKGREKMYDNILNSIQSSEEKLVKQETGAHPVGLRIPVSKEDVIYLYEEVWKGKSVISGLPTRLVFTRWRRPEGGFKMETAFDNEGQKYVKMDLGDLVCMTKEESLQHEKEVLLGAKQPEEVYDKDVLGLVNARFAEEASYSRFR